MRRTNEQIAADLERREAVLTASLALAGDRLKEGNAFAQLAVLLAEAAAALRAKSTKRSTSDE